MASPTRRSTVQGPEPRDLPQWIGTIYTSAMPDNVETLVPEQIAVGLLDLDHRNPRLGERGKTESLSQDEIIEILWREFAVDEIAYSIAANGYLPYEALVAEAAPGGRYVVIEGNRRLAAVRLLLDGELRQRVRATDLPVLPPERTENLQSLPVIVTTRQLAWSYIGFKHVNGPQPWDPLAKAQYIADVHEQYEVPLAEIATDIGDRHSTVRRLYRAHTALRQAAAAGAFSPDDVHKRVSFSHLYIGLDLPGIRDFVKVASDTDVALGAPPIPADRMQQFSELLVWLWGSKSRAKQPVVRSQNPDLRNLDAALAAPEGVDALRAGLPLEKAVEIAEGDTKALREILVRAKSDLQQAVGKVVTGYQGEADLLATTEAIRQLAEKLIFDMRDKQRELSRRDSDKPQ